MKRTLKIVLAFSCCVLGYELTLHAKSILSAGFEWLNPFLSGCGFFLMMVSGLYGMVKMARLFINYLDQVNNYASKR